MDTFNKTDDLYDPHFSIDGSNTDKLDMYGVWLKQKKDSTEVADEDFSQSIGGKVEQDIHSNDDFSFSDSFSELDNDDDIFELEEFTNNHEDILSDTASIDDQETNFSEDTFEALDLDDFLDSSASDDTESTNVVAEEEPIELDFIDQSSTETNTHHTVPLSTGIDSFDEISLEDFDKTPISDSSSSDNGIETFETIEEFDTIHEKPSDENHSVSKRKEIHSFDLDIPADDETNKAHHIEIASQAETADISMFDTDDEHTSSADSSKSEEAPFFDDIEAVEQDLLAPQSSQEQDKGGIQEMNTSNLAPSHQNTAAQEKATELLLQIAHEISDLKAELNSLKAGLAAQTNTSAELSTKPAVPQQEEHSEDSVSSGFFSDDDTDETIALTGDELNNILITADFTEEKNSEDENTDDYDIPEVLTEDIVPTTDERIENSTSDEDFEASITEPSIANQLAGDTDKDDDLREELEETEGEKLLASDPVFNVEPTPITSLPDDLSYLDGESIADEEHIEAISDASLQAEDIGDIEETVDEAELVEDENFASFDLPVEQEIQIPQEQENEADTNTVKSVSDVMELTETHTIHELQKDDDYTNPFVDTSHIQELEAEDEIIEEPFIEEISVPELKDEESLYTAKTDEKTSGKQETLLQAATQIINGERGKTVSIPLELKNEIKSVLAYMDQLLEALPEKKIEEFAKSEYFETYKHLFEELGIS